MLAKKGTKEIITEEGGGGNHQRSGFGFVLQFHHEPIVMAITKKEHKNSHAATSKDQAFDVESQGFSRFKFPRYIYDLMLI